MIEILKERIEKRQVKNLKVRKVDSDILPMENHICDLVILVTVLHHIEDKRTLVSEVRRILAVNGRLMIIGFHKTETSGGPPIEIKISKEELEDFARTYELKTIDKFDLGDNFYVYIFRV